MADTNSLPMKMVLPPDGRQTRIDFFGEKTVRRSSGDWWHSLSSWFKHESKAGEPDLVFFAQQLEKEGYSEKTRKSYLFMMKRFFDYYEQLEP